MYVVMLLSEMSVSTLLRVVSLKFSGARYATFSTK
jgi:hypothetical protein